MTARTTTIDVHLTPEELDAALRRDVAIGLTSEPKVLPPKWFYDKRGSELFEEITRLPEYYPTRREREILAARSAEVADVTGATTLVELGSGTSEKTLLLLDALAAGGGLRRFVPFDVDEATLREASDRIAARHPGLGVHAVVGDFERHLHALPADGGRRLVAFLGGTIGNLDPTLRRRFLDDLAAALAPGEHLLVGTDLVKDERRLVAAYDDRAGVTAEFNRNVLHVINHRLDAAFEPDAFDHVAVWQPWHEWIEMRLRAREAMTVEVPGAGINAVFAEGEEVRTEISAKFRRHGVEAELAASGFEVVRWWADAAGDFALSLSRRR